MDLDMTPLADRNNIKPVLLRIPKMVMIVFSTLQARDANAFGDLWQYPAVNGLFYGILGLVFVFMFVIVSFYSSMVYLLSSFSLLIGKLAFKMYVAAACSICLSLWGHKELSGCHRSTRRTTRFSAGRVGTVSVKALYRLRIILWAFGISTGLVFHCLPPNDNKTPLRASRWLLTCGDTQRGVIHSISSAHLSPQVSTGIISYDCN